MLLFVKVFINLLAELVDDRFEDFRFQNVRMRRFFELFVSELARILLLIAHFVCTSNVWAFLCWQCSAMRKFEDSNFFNLTFRPQLHLLCVCHMFRVDRSVTFLPSFRPPYSNRASSFLSHSSPRRKPNCMYFILCCIGCEGL